MNISEPMENLKLFETWLADQFNTVSIYEISGYQPSFKYIHDFTKVKDVEKLVIEHDWSMGGTSGNCYNDEKYQMSAEIKPEFTQLDELIASLKPNITYMQYKLKIIPLIKYTTTDQGDYYGGRTETGHEYVNLFELWTVLNAL